MLKGLHLHYTNSFVATLELHLSIHLSIRNILYLKQMHYNLQAKIAFAKVSKSQGSYNFKVHVCTTNIITNIDLMVFLIEREKGNCSV